MNDIEAHVNNNGPGVQKHTFPEAEESVVAEKHATDKLEIPAGVMLLTPLHVGILMKLIMMLQT